MVWSYEDSASSYTNTIDKINVYLGKLGKEQFLMNLTVEDDMPFPSRQELIILPRDEYENDIFDSDVYVVKQIITDYVHHEYNIFVELYDWED